MSFSNLSINYSVKPCHVRQFWGEDLFTVYFGHATAFRYTALMHNTPRTGQIPAQYNGARGNVRSASHVATNVAITGAKIDWRPTSAEGCVPICLTLSSLAVDVPMLLLSTIELHKGTRCSFPRELCIKGYQLAGCKLTIVLLHISAHSACTRYNRILRTAK